MAFKKKREQFVVCHKLHKFCSSLNAFYHQNVYNWAATVGDELIIKN